ncbi:helix-turn-helix domain-containing protein [Streptomyces sp. NPDC058382]|uniref:helix-turn-helix domain-containing protein n=1 Tax=unclassified Streptomyces TaxID=2593676 RepID=UPI003640EDA7
MSGTENPLGEALRAWRDRLSTEDVGLPATGRRRTAGLRREELAALAGVSVDYLLRLEQGRARRPSRHVLAALAQTLRLSADESCHLHLVAGQLPPAPGRVPDRVPPSVGRVVARLGDVPAGVFAADWTLLEWNAAWVALLGAPPAGPPVNLVRAVFVPGAASPGLPPGPFHAGFRTALVAELRLARAAYPDDDDLTELVTEARSADPDGHALWARSALGSRLGGRAVFGELALDCDVLKVPDADVRIWTYTAADGPDAARLASLVRVGTG